MAAIRSRDTSPEMLLRQTLRDSGIIGYRCHHLRLPGKPDIAFTRWRVAIFIDGAFWHGHPDHFTFGRLGAYWDDKVRRTQQRDREQERVLHGAGFTVLRFWDFEVKDDPQRCAAVIREVLAQAGRVSPGSAPVIGASESAD